MAQTRAFFQGVVVLAAAACVCAEVPVSRVVSGSTGTGSEVPCEFAPTALDASRLIWRCGTELWISDGTPSGTGPIQDLGASLGSLVAAGGRVFFAGGEGLTQGLWVSDGTSAGTRQLAVTGALGAAAIGFLTRAGSNVVFGSGSQGWGRVWVSDGTEVGTVTVDAAHGLRAVAALRDFAVFVDDGRDSSPNPTLWRTAGTLESTVRIKTFGKSYSVVALKPFGTGVLILLRRQDYSLELWASDLTTDGTKVFYQTRGALARVEGFAEVGARMFFAKDRQLWLTDGTSSGTRAVFVEGGPTLAEVPYLTAVGSTIFFVATDGPHGNELWRSDGTAAGTAMVTDLLPGPEGSEPARLLAQAGRLVMTAATEAVGRELWVSDGSAGGTVLLADLCPGTCSSLNVEGWSGVRGLVPHGGGFSFFAFSGDGTRLWASDGTGANTAPVASTLLRAPVDPAWPPTPPHIVLNGRLVFDDTGNDPNWHVDLVAVGGGPQDPTAVPVMPPEVHVTQFRPTDPIWNGALLLEALDRTSALWRADGTGPGTYRVADLDWGHASPVDALGRVFFLQGSSSPGNQVELWVTDGSPAGTRKVKRFKEGLAVGSLTTLGGRAVFGVADPVEGEAIWTSDGTEAGTVAGVDLCPGDCDWRVSADGWANVALGGKALLTFGDSTYRGLLATDGTPSGTEVLQSPEGTSLSAAVPLGGVVVFARAFAGASLWRTDGTAAGTSRLALFQRVSLERSSRAPLPPGQPLLFAADDGGHGDELWRTDGTAQGTALVLDIIPGPRSGRPRHFAVAEGRQWFAATDLERGRELWSSDGTPGSTRLEADVEPGPGSSAPSMLEGIGNRLFFQVLREPPGWIWAAHTSTLPRVDTLPAWGCDGPGCAGTIRVGITLSEPATTEVGVRYETVQESARPGEDYVAVAGEARIAVGSVGPVFVYVPVVPDTRSEGIERFSVHLVGVTGGKLGREWATVVLEDEARPGRARRRLVRNSP